MVGQNLLPLFLIASLHQASGPTLLFSLAVALLKMSDEIGDHAADLPAKRVEAIKIGDDQVFLVQGNLNLSPNFPASSFANIKKLNDRRLAASLEAFAILDMTETATHRIWSVSQNLAGTRRSGSACRSNSPVPWLVDRYEGLRTIRRLFPWDPFLTFHTLHTLTPAGLYYTSASLSNAKAVFRIWVVQWLISGKAAIFWMSPIYSRVNFPTLADSPPSISPHIRAAER